MHGIQGTWASPWLDVDLISMKSPSSLVTSAASIDVAADGILWDRYHADAGVEAWQCAKRTPTLAVLGGASVIKVQTLGAPAVAQSPQAAGALLLALRTGRIWIATLDSNRNRL